MFLRHKPLLKIFFFILLITSCKEEKKRHEISLPEKQSKVDDHQTKNQQNISITAVGDIMIGSEFPSSKLLPPNDGKESFKEVKKYLTGDIIFGNLEGCFLDHGISEKCRDKEPGKCYAFRMPERYSNIIKEAGFNTLSIANNHVGDFGPAGRKKTAELLDHLGLYYAGQTSKPSAIFEINGVTYGFCAFAPNNNTVSINDISNAESIVRELKSKVDIVIVSFHGGGGEGASHTRVPKTNEYYFGENRGNVHKFSHAMIDAGADIVLGHGPHVLRAVEVYKKKFIAYSLGNFNTYGKFSLNGPNGIAAILNIELNSDGDFISSDVISTKQTKQKGLFVDINNKGYETIKKLTNQDFPNHGLVFKDNKISIKE